MSVRLRPQAPKIVSKLLLTLTSSSDIISEKEDKQMAKTKTTKTVIKSKTVNNRVTIGGVYFRTDKNRYVARFTLNGKRINVGSFMSERKARQALKEARAQYSW